MTDLSTDAESGNEGLTAKEDKKKSLYALKVMRDKKLINEEEYQKRKSEIEQS